MNRRPHGNPFLLLLTAVIILGALSVMRWDNLTSGKLKNFDLLADVLPGHAAAHSDETPVDTYIDPDLLAIMDAEVSGATPSGETSAPNSENSDALSRVPAEDYVHDSSRDIGIIDISDNESPGAPPSPAKTENKTETKSHATAPGHPKSDSAKPAPLPSVRPPEVVRRADGVTPIEDYSPARNALSRFSDALNRAGSRNVRIAVIGDSYIEGDIFTEYVRSSLQEQYGGSGIGYSPLFSEIPGFRRSVIMNCSGWKQLDWRNSTGSPYAWLPGFSSRSTGKATTNFSGSSKIPRTSSWDLSRLLFISPEGGTVNVRTDAGDWDSYPLDADPDRVQMISVPGTTSKLSVSTSTPGIIGLGAFLDSDHGVSVDNMSIRGYSGIRHDELNSSVIDQMRLSGIDYDLIILEYGINALSAAQTNYDAYGHKMTQVIRRIRKLYPRADILLMGIGDRGQKSGGEIHSMSTIPSMIATQRSVAKATGVAFWDTQAAMGGRDAVVEWSRNKEVNKDYIHMSFTGGKRLAREFVNALNDAVQ
ncbi:MAG: hypothetical protein K2M04_05885 [Muribaculaceae bacterium]|nr:hypothetical protein [Muribaculaceae bacterium]